MHRGRSVCRVPAMQPVITPHYFQTARLFSATSLYRETDESVRNQNCPRSFTSRIGTENRKETSFYTTHQKKTKTDDTHSCLKSICGSTWIEPGVNSVERFRMAGSFVFLVGPHRRNSYRGSSGSAGARCRAE